MISTKSEMRTINILDEIYKLGDKVNSYNHVCVMTIEPAPSDEEIFEMASVYGFDRLENDSFEVVLIAGFPVRTRESYNDCIEFLIELTSKYPDKIFVSGICFGKLTKNIIKEAKNNKMLVDEIFETS